MMKLFRCFIHQVHIGLAILGFISLLGCAVGESALGPPFEKISNTPLNDGLVYMYRPTRSDETARPKPKEEDWCYIMANGEVVASLFKGGYYPYFAPPGKTEFNMNGSKVSVEVQAGQMYYLRATSYVGIGIAPSHSVRPHLGLVSHDTGEREIKDCKIMQTMRLPALP